MFVTPVRFLAHQQRTYVKNRGATVEDQYGIYDVGRDAGYVVIGTSHETPAFAGAAIRRWWMEVGRRSYAGTRRLLIQADGGGANDSRKLAWKVALQGLADEFRLIITMMHYPPGASKWNLIEHRMFSLICQ